MTQDDLAQVAILDELRRSAIDTYGEERTAESPFHNILRAAANSVWRVFQEPLEPTDDAP